MAGNGLPPVLLSVVGERTPSNEEQNDNYGSVRFGSVGPKDRGSILFVVFVGAVAKVIVLGAFFKVSEDFVCFGYGLRDKIKKKLRTRERDHSSAKNSMCSIIRSTHHKSLPRTLGLILIWVPHTTQIAITLCDRFQGRRI